MSEVSIPGLKSGHQMITPTCRENRGSIDAFDEATARLRSTYARYADTAANGGVTWHLVLVRDEGSSSC